MEAPWSSDTPSTHSPTDPSEGTMSRLSREKRDQQGTAQPAVLAAAPIDVLVDLLAGASVGGVPVTPIPGEEIHQTVLNHLHRIALATGHPVHATVHDNRIGYVLALRIDADGSSQFTAKLAPMTPPGVPGGGPLSVREPGNQGQASYAVPGTGEPGEAFGPEGSGRVSYAGEPGQVSYAGESGQVSPSREHSGEPRDALRRGEPGGAPYSRGQGQAPYSVEAGEVSRPTPPTMPPRAFAPGAAESAQPALPSTPADFVPGAAESGGASTPSAAPPTAGPVGSAEPADQPPRDKPTHLFRQTPEPPTFPLRALQDPEGQEPRDAVPTFRLRAVPEWVADAAPGTVAPRRASSGRRP